MRILFLSCNTGEGHNSTAKAIMEVLETQGSTCEIRDVLAWLSPRFSKFICSWHTRIYRYAPRLFDASYRAMEKRGAGADTSIYDILSLGAEKLWELLLEEQYDAVVCVHVFSGMMMTEVRRTWGVKIPCFFVATDYTCSPTVEQCIMDGYIIPAAELSGEFVNAGLPADKLLPLGIPVRQAFYKSAPRKEAREKLGLPEGGVLALVMCGSMGAGPMHKIVRKLTADMPENGRVVAICGRNERLLETLSEEKDPRLTALGYTTNVDEYMDAADFIITKPGGLSSTEAANKHLPMVFINAVGGCEGRNFDFFLKSGFAVGSEDADEVVTMATSLAHDPERLETMRQNLSKAFTTNSAAEIAACVTRAAENYRGIKKVALPAEAPAPAPETGPAPAPEKKTAANLARAILGESQARTRYTVYAGIARQEGNERVARLFEETAANEAVHAECFLRELRALGIPGTVPDLTESFSMETGTTAENLRYAAEGERQEYSVLYPEFARVAAEEGFDSAARLWAHISRAEEGHERLFRRLERGMSTAEVPEGMWRCMNCGYVYETAELPEHCPVCGKGPGWQQPEGKK